MCIRDRSGSAFRYALWWLALSALGSVVLLIVDRAARRLLPLAALLRLSLVFPDAAPSRFRAPAFLVLDSSTVTVTAVDNGGTANGGSDTSAPRAATITIIVG